MAAADIVIHKGEKEEQYQLYVEDYVMSYLKNYEAENGGKIFFFGKREQKNRKYYLYGAGQQREISYFAQYELLEEIACRPAQDMPVFFVQKEDEMYELAGYYIFYQSNEAMQNYMVEQRKTAGAGERMRNRERVQAGGKSADSRKIVRPQTINRPQAGTGTPQGTSAGSRMQSDRRMTEKTKGGLMAVQLSAIFVILIAIVINSTNSYTKLEELNQAAVEVFFAMENEEAAGTGKQSGEAVDADLPAEDTAGFELSAEEAEGADNQIGGTEDVPAEGTVLRLEDLDVKFEEENEAAKQEEPENGEIAKADGDENQSGQDKAESSAESAQEDSAEESAESGQEDSAEESAESGQEEEGGESASAEEMAPSEQAFARNFAEYYKIEKGDTLYKISIKIYGDTGKVKEICELNKIKDPDNIKYGQKILLP